jgi:hypothetical protein
MALRIESNRKWGRLLASLLLLLLWMPAMVHGVQVLKFVAAQPYGFNVRGFYEVYDMAPTGVISGGGYTEIHVFPNNPFHVGNYNSLFEKYVIAGTEARQDGTGAYDPINNPNITDSFQLGPKVPLGFSPTQQATFFRTISVIPGPEITVKGQGGQDAASGAAVSFLSTEIGAERTLSYQISNTGNQNLSGLAVTIVGSSDFTVTQPQATLVPGGASLFSIRFRPTTNGVQTATLRIANNDPNENPFLLTLTGTGTGTAIRKIEILDSSGVVMANNAGGQDFGSPPLQTSVLRNVTIANSGSLPLDHLAVSLTGTHAGDFTVGFLPASLAPGAMVQLSIHFTPSALGPRNASVSVASNDSANNPYTFHLTGNGLVAVTFDTWIQESGLEGADAAADAMPFGDGVPNLLKYAFNLKPDGPDARRLTPGGTAGLPAVSVTRQGPNIVMRIEYLRRKNSVLTYTPKRSHTLLPGSFTRIVAIPMVTSIDNEWERVVVQTAESSSIRASFGIVEVTEP